jgi:pimeloyl-ACP methyl ester carboxylesterase
MMAQTQPALNVKTVLLAHEAWADGSSSLKVIPLLEAKGLHVIAVQIPLTSFADDVLAAKRAIALEKGPILLVGHSYGGAVTTAAGNDPKWLVSSCCNEWGRLLRFLLESQNHRSTS